MNYCPIKIHSNIMMYIMPYLCNVCPSHGILHMQTVFNHAVNAIEAHRGNILSENEKSSIVIAAFLHDIDDRKFFNTINYDNARQIVKNIGHAKNEELIIKMIDYVSSSKNRNEISEECAKNSWLLVPRHCDRIEAIGIIGLERTYRYTKTTNCKLFNESTKRYTFKEALFCEELLYRYNTYTGHSATMIDHMYDKLLHICNDEVGNEYIDKIIKERNKIMMDFCIRFGKGEFENEDAMERYILSLEKLF